MECMTAMGDVWIGIELVTCMTCCQNCEGDMF